MQHGMPLSDVNTHWADCFLIENAGLHMGNAAMSELMLGDDGLLINYT